MNHLPAIFGHKPMFAKRLHIARPLVPTLSDLSADLSECLNGAVLSKGPQLEMLEQEAAEYLGVRNAVAVSNCTSGLLLAYRSLGLTGEAVIPS